MATKTKFNGAKYATFTIANGAANSSILDLEKYILVGIIFPSTMTGTGLTVSLSQDQSNFNTVYIGADLTVAKQDSKAVMLDKTFSLTALAGIGRYVRFASSGNEGAGRTFTAILLPR